MSKPAVFLDRDGTINKEVHHLSTVDQFALLPGSGEAVKRLNQAEMPVVVITNQSVVARGMVSLQDLTAINKAMTAQLADEEAYTDALYFCPHHPTAGSGPLTVSCGCRKPQPGMLLMAAEELNLALEHSFMVGDSYGDLAAGKAAGCRTVLVQTGHGAKTLKQLNGRTLQPDFIATDLLEATEWILQQEG